MLVTSIFSFPHIVFKRLLYMGSFNPFPNKPWFLRVCYTTLLKTLGKGEIARNEQFLLFHNVFYLFEELSAISIEFKIVVCKLFKIGRVKKLSFGKGLGRGSVVKSLNLLPNNPWFSRSRGTCLFENIVGKGENAGNQHFLLFPQYFLSFPHQTFNFYVGFTPRNLDHILFNSRMEVGLESSFDV